MRPSFSPLQFALLVFLVGFLLAFVQIGALTIAFDKLGLSQSSAFTLLFASLIGSMINLPLFSVKASPVDLETVPAPWRELVRKNQRDFKGKTLIALNVGGALIPLLFSVYLMRHNVLHPFDVVLVITIVAAISRVASRPVSGLGVTMPIFIAPVTAALAAIAIDPQQSAPLAYIGGTLGVLIGADLLRLKDIRKMGAPLASIGGAGTFDGIFLTGLVAVLLA
ncbi:MAG: DUF1614 domain-containing protein [Pseudomonadota bacterium]